MSNNDIGLAAEIIIMAIVISVILLFLGIGLLVVIHACIVGRSFRNNSSAANNQRASPIPGRTASMSRDDLDKLPSYDFIAKSKGSSPADCAVCLDNFKVGDKCRLLPVCNHSFHAQCVDEWILKTPICPICRTSTTADSRRAIGDEESSNFSDTNSIDIRGSFTTDSSRHFSDAAANIEFTESISTESTHCSTSNT